MEIGKVIDSIIFFGRKPPEAIKWEELRKRILDAIDEEKERGAGVIISSSTVGAVPHIVYEEEGYIHTANEASCIYTEEDALKVSVA